MAKRPNRRWCGSIAAMLAVVLLVPVLAAGPLASPARAQYGGDILDLKDRMRRIEQQMRALKTSPGAASTLYTKLSQLERSIQALTGKIEDLAYKVQQIEKANAKFRNDIEFRLGELEKGRAGPARRGAARPAAPPNRRQAGDRRRADDRQAPPDRSKKTTVVRLPDGKPAEQYRYAISLLRRADYDAAEQAFKLFIKAHATHQLTGNAYYWLGETYYVRSRYKEAAVAFATGFQKFPKHAKAPDSLLKLGMSMARLNKNQEACASFAELRRRYPNAGNHVKKAVNYEQHKLGCTA